MTTKLDSTREGGTRQLRSLVTRTDIDIRLAELVLQLHVLLTYTYVALRQVSVVVGNLTSHTVRLENGLTTWIKSILPA